MEELDLMLDLLAKAHGFDSDIYCKASNDYQNINESIAALKSTIAKQVLAKVEVLERK